MGVQLGCNHELFASNRILGGYREPLMRGVARVLRKLDANFSIFATKVKMQRTLIVVNQTTGMDPKETLQTIERFQSIGKVMSRNESEWIVEL